jgi:hypothetical protein
MKICFKTKILLYGKKKIVSVGHLIVRFEDVFMFDNLMLIPILEIGVISL